MGWSIMSLLGGGHNFMTSVSRSLPGPDWNPDQYLVDTQSKIDQQMVDSQSSVNRLTCINQKLVDCRLTVDWDVEGVFNNKNIRDK